MTQNKKQVLIGRMEAREAIRKIVLDNIAKTKSISRYSILDDSLQYKGATCFEFGIFCSTKSEICRGYTSIDVFKIPKYSSTPIAHRDLEEQIAQNILKLTFEASKWKEYARTDYSYWRYDASKMAEYHDEEIMEEEDLLVDLLATPYLDKPESWQKTEPYEARTLTAEQWEQYKQEHLNPRSGISDKIKSAVARTAISVYNIARWRTRRL